MSIETSDRLAAPSRLRLEYHESGAIGVAEARPRISWQVDSAPRDYVQDRYEVEVTVEDAVGRIASSTSVVASTEQVLVPWPATSLRSRDIAAVRVRVAGAETGWSDWSEPARAEVGLLSPSDWVAQLIEPSWDEQLGSERRPPLFRREFSVAGDVRRARLYVTAHGLTELEINGQRVGNDALLPGWSSYHHRLRFATYDVSDLVRNGGNAIGAWTGDGWYRGRIGFEGGSWDIFGDTIGVFAQLEIVTEDGETLTVHTDENWSCEHGAILASSIYDGETFDAREIEAGWSAPGFSGDWKPVHVGELDKNRLAAHDGAFIRCAEEIDPVQVRRTDDGRHIIDFGQNHTGRLRLRVEGEIGTRIVVRHAEVLQDGELYTRTLREAAQTDTLVLGPEPVEWEPRFTLHGYRYAEITGWPGDIQDGDIVSRVYHTPMRRTGWFSTSDADVQQLHDNITWSMRSNFVDIPMDCPQRDERLGWTGDLLIFAPAGAWLYDDAGMLSDWLRSVSAEQKQFGPVPWYVPFVPGNDYWDPHKPGAVWGDVAAQLPLLLYRRRGDKDLLARQYESARTWVDLVEQHAGADRIWESDWQPGDWLDPSAPADNPAASRTDPNLIATAYFARSAAAVAETAQILGHELDTSRYGELADEIRSAFASKYILADGRVTSDTQTAYALVLNDDLSPQHREVMGDRLAELVEEAGATIATGFIGTPIICDALTSTGHAELAYRLLEQRHCPSWLYPVTMGATTMWERWDSLRSDGTVNPGDMTSFNHYALGAISDWLYRSVAGIAAEEPGFRTIRFAPVPGGTLRSAGAKHDTPYGLAEVSWTSNGADVELSLVVPVGSTAVLELPGRADEPLTHGTHTRTIPADTWAPRARKRE